MSNAVWPHDATVARPLVTLDGGFRTEARVQRPDRYSFFRQTDLTKPTIARGAGLSFAAASFGGDATTVDLAAFDRILSFDSTQGVVEVEAGISLAALFAFLEANGFYLPTQPGYAAISVGGCIAADVHGKNAVRDGTFINQVVTLRLFHPKHGFIDLSHTEEPELFRATCGGFGLTGIIVTAKLKAKPILSPIMEATTFGVSDLTEGAQKIVEMIPSHDGIYGWHDLTYTDSRFGRGHVVAMRFAHPGSPGPRSPILSGRLNPVSRERLPFSALNAWTVPWMNAAYRALNTPKRTTRSNLFSAMFPFHGKETYFALYGRGGFHESQVIVPHERLGDYIEALRTAIRATRITIAFSALKMFAGESDLIRFDGTGVSLAIHLPRSAASPRFLEAVDEATLAVGGRPNAIKDLRLPRRVFESAYPECDRFRKIIRDWDPSRTFRSELSTRLTL